MLAARINKGFFKSISSLKLDRCRWFSGAIVHDAVDVFDFVYDSTGCSSDDIPRDFGAFGCHEIGGGDGAEGDGIIIRSFISHDSNGTHVGQGCEVLADFVGDSGFVDFFAPDRVGVLYHFDFLGGYFADDTDAKSRAREWLTEYEVFRDAELKAGFSYFVFEEVAQRLDDFFEIYVVRQSSDVMMGFDDGGFSADAALYNVWVDGSLYQEVYSTNFLCFFFEDADELFADDFTFSLRLFYAF